MSRSICVVIALLALMLGACATDGTLAPDAASRAAAAVACNLQLASLSLALSKDAPPEDRLAMIQGASSNPAIAQACAVEAAGLAQDIAAAKAKIGK